MACRFLLMMRIGAIDQPTQHQLTPPLYPRYNDGGFRQFLLTTGYYQPLNGSTPVYRFVDF